MKSQLNESDSSKPHETAESGNVCVLLEFLSHCLRPLSNRRRMRWFDADKHRKIKYSRGSAALCIGTALRTE